MFHFFLLLNPVYVTFFWCLVLNSNTAKGNAPKSFLGKLMAVAFLLYLSHLFYYLPLPAVYHYADPFYLLCNLLMYPMYYIYIRLLTVDEGFSFRKHGLFLLPAVLMFALYGVGVLCMSKDEHLHYLYRSLCHLSDEKLSGIFLYQKTIYSISRVVFITQGLVYMWFSFRLVVKNKNNVQKYYANTADDTLNNVHCLNVSLLIVIGFGIILSFFGKEHFIFSVNKMIVPSVVLSVMFFIVGWLGNRQRQVLTDNRQEEKDLDTAARKDDISTAQPEQIRLKVEQLFDEQKIYLNKDLTIWEVARMAGTNRTYISNIINNDFKQNFSSFVNAYRVKHARTLLEANPGISKAELAEMSGFGSVLSMQRAFRAI